jgi:hypothetical protein
VLPRIPPPSSAWRRHAAILGFALLIGLTNRWLVDEPGFSLHGYDSVSYLAIADAFPGLPTTIDLTRAHPERGEEARHLPLPHHHAQRLTGAYVVGALAWLGGLPTLTVFAIVNPLLLAATLACLLAAGRQARLGPRAGLLLAALFLANPHLVRFNLTIPTYTGDTLFLLGTALLLYGGLRRSFGWIVLGLALAALGRQTALLLLPGLFLWLRTTGQGSAGRLLLLLSVGLGIYGVTGAIAGLINPHSHNLDHVLGLGTWWQNRAATGSAEALRYALTHEFQPFLIRVLLPLALPLLLLGMLALRRRLQADAVMLAWGLMTLGVLAQPLLAGPHVTANQGARLTALGLLPLLLATTRAVDRTGVLMRLGAGHGWALGGLLLAGSLHHRYTVMAAWTGAETAYIVLTLATMTGLGWLFYRALGVDARPPVAASPATTRSP